MTGFQPGQVQGTWPELRYHQVNEEWQHVTCTTLGLQFVQHNGLGGGGPDVILTRPLNVRGIMGDGNCLFRCLSYAVTGSESQYHTTPTKICDHLISIAHFMLSHHIDSEYTSIKGYLQDTPMDSNYTWGTEVEILTFAHMTNTRVLVFSTDNNTWSVGDVDRTQQRCYRESSVH